MLKKILVGLIAAAVIAIGGSLIHPFGTAGTPGNNEAILREAQIDPETLALFERACQNCHSERTEWPWYSHVAPISWLLTRDVQQARLRMNLSRWQDYSSSDRLSLLSGIGGAVRNRKMPVQRYLLLHPEARLTEKERQQIYEWTRTERGRLRMRQTRTTSLRLTAKSEQRLMR
jgi:heme-binding protein